jgi:hypothetical protein
VFVVLVLAAAAILVVVVTVYALSVARRRTGTPAPSAEDAELAELERSDDPLLRTVARLTRRIGLAERFQRRLRWLLRILLTLGAALLVVAVVVVGLVLDARQRTDQRDLDLADARYAGCVQYNLGQVNTREAIVGGIVDGFRPFAVAAGNAADLETFAADLRRSVDARLPYRDCSPSGLARYLYPPPDPATSISTTTTPSSSSS